MWMLGKQLSSNINVSILAMRIMFRVSTDVKDLLVKPPNCPVVKHQLLLCSLTKSLNSYNWRNILTECVISSQANYYKGVPTLDNNAPSAQGHQLPLVSGNCGKTLRTSLPCDYVQPVQSLSLHFGQSLFSVFMLSQTNRLLALASYITDRHENVI